ncbi:MULTISPECIES: hypothetical protein [Methanoculleus]|uniref:Lipoprotein n=2 Tax=Methanoculleus TaxID=45989 RepID=A3CYE8_METMJ|nr:MULTISPECIES: hypothetical protein [Methanoculleus]ABN58398.1 hypothetical protein Memar_2477 [Methanoculleus marisnigri JR1]UYU17396.1 hypothetical protein OH143_06660 [Methanoculleus submarinus]
MQGRHILVLILLAAAVIAGGCTAEEDIADAQPVSPTPAPTEAQAVGGSLPVPTPPVPVRGEGGPQSVGFVDPATYHLSVTPTPTATMVKPPNDIRISEKMVEYAVVSCDGGLYGRRVLTTEVYHIPFPYWEATVSATAATEYPWLVVEIRDPDDPNRLVEEIRHFRGDILEVESNATRNNPVEKEKTFVIQEGYDDYYFVTRSESLESFKIVISVPEKYLV